MYDFVGDSFRNSNIFAWCVFFVSFFDLGRGSAAAAPRAGSRFLHAQPAAYSFFKNLFCFSNVTFFVSKHKQLIHVFVFDQKRTFHLLDTLSYIGFSFVFDILFSLL